MLHFIHRKSYSMISLEIIRNKVMKKQSRRKIVADDVLCRKH